MKKLFMTLLCAVICGTSAFAGPSRLEANEVSASNLKSILSERFGTSIDDGGRVIIKKGKYLQVTLVIDSEQSRLCFGHGWSAKPGLDTLKCLKKVNHWNIERAFNSLTYNADDKVFFWYYYIVYTGGINATNLLDTVGALLENEELFVKTFYEAGMLE